MQNYCRSILLTVLVVELAVLYLLRSEITKFVMYVYPNYERVLNESQWTVVQFQNTQFISDLEGVITVPFLSPPCDEFFKKRVSCEDRTVYIFKNGELYEKSRKFENSKHILHWIDLEIRGKEMNSTQNLESEIQRCVQDGQIVLVHFSTTCTTWTFGEFLLFAKSKNMDTRYLYICNEQMTKQYTNKTSDSFMAVSQYDRVFSQDYERIPEMTKYLSRPILSRISQHDYSSYMHTVYAVLNVPKEDHPLVEQVRQVAKEFRGRVIFFYDVKNKKPVFHVNTPTHYHSYYYNFNENIVDWVESVLNGTAVWSDDEQVQKEPFLRVIGNTYHDFMNQDKDIVLITENRYKQMDTLEAVAKRLAHVDTLVFGFIDRQYNDVPLYTKTRLDAMFCPVGEKEDPYCIDYNGTEDEVIEQIRKYAVASKYKF